MVAREAILIPDGSTRPLLFVFFLFFFGMLLVRYLLAICIVLFTKPSNQDLYDYDARDFQATIGFYFKCDLTTTSIAPPLAFVMSDHLRQHYHRIGVLDITPGKRYSRGGLGGGGFW